MFNASRFFFWKPGQQRFSFLPIRFIKGSDEQGWHTFGMLTWFGSVFYRYEKCTCPDIMKEYNDILNKEI